MEKDYAGVKGLIYIPGFISKQRERYLMRKFDMEEWQTIFGRRVQQFGYEYDYHKKTASKRAAAIPEFLNEEMDEFVLSELFETYPEQIIVNEYNPGTGISAHTDAPCFGPTIASLSLGSDCVMTFQKGSETKTIRLERLSLLVMTGEARTKWRHSIPDRKVDDCDVHNDMHVVIHRERRMSITFRTLGRSHLVGEFCKKVKK